MGRGTSRPRPASTHPRVESRPAAIGRAAGRAALTGTSRAWEILVRPKARAVTDVPVSPGAITGEWLTAVLCRGHPGARVTDFRVSDASSQTTSRAALRVTYSGAGSDALPQDVFVKLSETAKQRMLLGLIRVLDGEPIFYGQLRPLADFECPVGHFGGYHPRTWASVVVIENIAATRGATFCNATTAIDRPRIESLLATMAAYHGAFWEHPEIERAALKRPTDHLHNVSVFLNMRKQSAIGVERAGAQFPDSLRPRQGELWDALGRSMELCSRGGPMTLLHGDPHVGNTYVTADGRMALTDWQVTMRGLWSFDFSGAVVSALTVDDRRAWERDLLALYLDRLAHAGGQPPGFDDAWRLYRQCLMYPLHCWTTVLGAPAWMPDTQPAEVSKLIIERAATAIDDLDALAAF